MTGFQHKWKTIRFLSGLWVGLVPIAFGQVGPDGIGGPDPFGYTFLDQNDPECSLQFVDISASGAPVGFTASGAAPAGDDGGAVILLEEQFLFYGTFVSKVVMSSNGYLAVAESLAAEDGGDFSNDCELPAVPGNAAGANARIMAYHDELSANGGGTAQTQFFESCPRTPASGEPEACTVFQWTDWGLLNSLETFDFQVLLYHGSFEIAVQVNPGESGGGAEVTLGIQDGSATSALQYSCNEPGGVPGSTAVCFFEPNFPARPFETDLSLSLSSPTAGVVPGGTVAYLLEVENLGSRPVTGASIADLVPAGVGGCTWTCIPSRGSQCSPGPIAGDLVDLPDLQVNGRVAYTFRCEVPVDATQPIVNSASVETPANMLDTDGDNNDGEWVHQLCPLPAFFFDGLPDWPANMDVLDLVPLIPPCPAP